MLKAENLTKRYDKTDALTTLNLEVGPGEIYCLLGANGAGKSTTIRLFLNFTQPTEGRALVKGIDVSQEPLETKRHLAYIPEQVMLYPHLTGRENLEYFAALAGHADYSRVQFHEFLTRCGLEREAHDQRVSVVPVILDGADPLAKLLAQEREEVREVQQRASAVLRMLRDGGERRWTP